MAGKRRGNKEGSIYETATGWRGYISLEGDRRKYVSGQTRREVADKLRQLQKEQEQGRDIGAPDQTLTAWLITWLDDVRRTRAARTYQTYTDVAERYIVPSLGRMRLNSIKPAHIQRTLNDLHDSELSSKTVALVKGVLGSSLSRAVKQRILPYNPTTGCYVPTDDAPFAGTALTAEQVQRLLATAGDHRLFGLFRVAVSTGMRSGEIRHLEWRDLDADKRTLHIRVSKTGARTIALTDDLIAVLKQQAIVNKEWALLTRRYTQNDLIFPGQRGVILGQGSLVHTLHRLCDTADIPRIRFHDLRHTAISLLLEAGTPVKVVMALVGHTQMNTTITTYAHSTPDAERAALTAVEALFGT